MSVTPDYRIKAKVLTLSTSCAPSYILNGLCFLFVPFAQSAPPVSLAIPAPWRLLEAESHEGDSFKEFSVSGPLEL